MKGYAIIGLALLAAVFAADGERTRARRAVKLGPDGKPVKVKSPADLLAEAKAEGRKEAEAEHKAKAAELASMRKLVRREMRYREPPRAASGGGDDE